MVEDSQEPTAPEGAPSAEPPAPVEASEAAPVETTAEAPQDAAHSEPSPPVSLIADWGHLRGLQAVETPAPSWAEREDYAEELTKELSVRAARFVRSVDDSVVLASDGLMRWLGDPVARLVEGEKVLEPRAVLLADDALAGEAREAAQTRANLWIAAHVRKLLGPLAALESGADLPEAARGLGAKIGEALGVLERERVRNEVRALDQSTRGAFRKLGVRFGSLYIYVPLLLKPGPRALCTQLWMLKRGSELGADRLLAFASAGRTSFANDGALSPEAYRVAGFRLCGERVVRVDITERLSDLIRAALPDLGRGGARSASEAYGFLVTPQMTSLTGCSGEAFASILRSLGFEALKVSKAAFELARRKAPTEPIKPAGESPAAIESAPASEGVETGEPADPSSAAPVENVDAQAAEGVEAEVVEAEAVPKEPEAVEAPAEEIEAPVPTGEGETEALAEEAPETLEAADAAEAESNLAEEAAAEVAAAPEEEIEIWRPAPRRQRAPQRPPRAARSAAPPAPHRDRGSHRPAAKEPERPVEPVAAEPSPAGKRRDETPRRFEGKGEKPRREDRREFTPRRDSRPADPDSPFAKLAALKPLLEQRDKRN